MIDEKTRLVAEAMARRRRDLIAEPLARIWTELAETAIATAAAADYALQSAKPKEAEEFVRVPKERYRELVAEELWNAFNCGIERDGKWMDGGRSEGEWLVRRLGLPDDGWHDAEVMKGMMAAAVDRAMLSAAGDANDR